ncbi:hypothetical protein PACTADRAFT_400 [Pachysolen tannophilus NRRL Y-2460]|uniref:PABS domain-containing protein n=1 Tax=Pachysolen tannophilus NRRL Y-2460 TaxID=669874 RepID=A0A1E4U1P4_PACTA|nr:hypothetical protein PACTADRAFT_400 [Pachysolen tannophilus NRRL Y-2460]
MQTHPTIKDGWFREISETSFPGQAFCLKVKRILHSEKSEFQDILVFESESYGNVLVLDGIVQCTERDEFAYQELISHIPLFSHPNPKRILVIGGGDGGVLREVVKHGDTIESVTLVEIDETVIKLSKKYLPNMAKGFDHEKVKVVLDDGFKFLKKVAQENNGKYDIIITDSSDPEGPAEAFFRKNYFELMYNALNDDGIVITQASENCWLNVDKLKDLKKICKQVFPIVEYGYVTIPSYTSGQLGLMCCSKKLQITEPIRKLSTAEESKLFKYYNSEIHKASFIHPTWAKKLIDGN